MLHLVSLSYLLRERNKNDRRHLYIMCLCVKQLKKDQTSLWLGTIKQSTDTGTLNKKIKSNNTAFEIYTVMNIWNTSTSIINLTNAFIDTLLIIPIVIDSVKNKIHTQNGRGQRERPLCPYEGCRVFLLKRFVSIPRRMSSIYVKKSWIPLKIRPNKTVLLCAS